MAAVAGQLRRYRGAITQRGLSLILLTLRKLSDLHYGLSCASHFTITRGEWLNAVRSLRSILDPPSPGRRVPRSYYRLARKVQQARIESPTRRITQALFKAVAPPEKIIWIRPDEITRRTRNDLSLYCNDILPGDWDLQTKALATKRKHRALVQRFQDGVEWQETELFSNLYTRRLERGAVVRGTQDISELTRYYETYFDGLYTDIKEYGFQVAFDERGMMDIPHVHIGRDGRVLFGNNGNHRLTIAKILGVERIPCRVRARHQAWQQLRDRIATHGPERCWKVVDRKFATHPDLVDLLGSDPDPSREEDLDSVAVHIASMRGTRTGLLLRKLARDAPAGTSVVQVGCWLGAGTAQLALGIRERRDAGDVRLHCYDQWQASHADVKRAASRSVNLSVGEDLLPRVRRTLEPFKIPIRFHKGELDESGWRAGPISVYVDDTSEAPDLFYHLLRTFGSSWVPGETVIVFMDFESRKKTAAADHTFRHHVVESNRQCFEPLESKGHAVFLYREPVDFDKLASTSRIWSLSAQIRARDVERRRLWSSTSWRVTAPLRRCADASRGWLGSGRRDRG